VDRKGGSGGSGKSGEVVKGKVNSSATENVAAPASPEPLNKTAMFFFLLFYLGTMVGLAYHFGWITFGNSDKNVKYVFEITDVNQINQILCPSPDSQDTPIEYPSVALAFTSTKCTPCKSFKKYYREIAKDVYTKELDSIKIDIFVSLDVNLESGIRSKFNVKSIPTVFMYSNTRTAETCDQVSYKIAGLQSKASSMSAFERFSKDFLIQAEHSAPAEEVSDEL